MNTLLTKEQIKEQIAGKLMRHYQKNPHEATGQQIFSACAFIIRDILVNRLEETEQAKEKSGQKQVYYLSMEFLIGRLLSNNIINLGLKQQFDEALSELGYRLNDIEESEPDPALGNGGLGRLAACYLDSLTTLGLPGNGFTLRYEYGIFKQKMIDGMQVELPDPWLDYGEAWQIKKEDEMQVVRFGGKVTEVWREAALPYYEITDTQSIIAMPYDVPVSGGDSKVVNTLRLWSASSPESFNMSLFNKGQFIKSIEQRAMAEMICKVLYPDDNHYEGKELRLKQQYFFVSATIQSIVKNHMKKHDIKDLPDYVAIHINDTHPALAIPELMRILMDMNELPWDEAWNITRKVFAYTNHTVMSEALERWPLELVKTLIPRIFMILSDINERYCRELWSYYPGDWDKISKMSIIAYNEIRMANLCASCCHKINGVSKLHSEIIKKDLFADFYKVTPERFINVTNGITQRRWLQMANPGLTDLITEVLGTDWKKDLTELSHLKPFALRKSFRTEFNKVKSRNKKALAKYIYETTGIKTDPNSLFDVQVKRLHEYKRQLLNVMNIIDMYNRILEDPTIDMAPRTFIFAAKAAPGYYMAKKIIKLIHSVGNTINNDPRIGGKIKVVFLEDYKVSLAERIIPAANLSEQISVAGKEASGTGNMKLMLNGAITIGTMDGANVEIFESVGANNIFIFGLSSQEVEELYRSGKYNANEIYNNNSTIKMILDQIKNGYFGYDHGFSDIVDSLIYGNDPYLLLADFDAYRGAQQLVDDTYKDTHKWAEKAILNVAGAGIFTSDRSVAEYAKNIWNIKPIKL